MRARRESKEDLAGLAPKDCIIPAKPVERLAAMGVARGERLNWNSIARGSGDLYLDMPRRNWASHKSTAA